MIADEGAMELPINIVVLTIVGMVALAFMLGSMPTDIVPKTMSADVVSGSVISLPGGIGRFDVDIRVTDVEGSQVSGANVVLRGFGAAGSGVTGDDGIANVKSSGEMHMGSYEGYLRLTVMASGYRDYNNDYAVKVIRV